MYVKARQRTQKHILDATLHCLLRDGYRKLTVTAIAEVADIGRGTFYTYFNDADDALFTLVRKYFHELHADIHDFMLIYDSPEKELRAWQLAYEQAVHVKPLFAILADTSAPYLAQRFEAELIAGFHQSLAMDVFLYPKWMNLPLDVMATFSGGAVFALMRRWFLGELDYSALEMATMTHQLLYHTPVQNREDEA